jgi:hypothetical protein
MTRTTGYNSTKKKLAFQWLNDPGSHRDSVPKSSTYCSCKTLYESDVKCANLRDLCNG